MHLVWLRTDIRLADNPALYYACDKARRYHQPIQVIFCDTPQQWQLQHDSPAKISFQADALTHLRQKLHQLGVKFKILRGTDYQSCVELITEEAKTSQATDIWWNTEVPVYEQNRDAQVSTALKPLNVVIHRFDADFLVPPEGMRTQQGGHYKVFTPWYRLWQTRLDGARDLLPEPQTVSTALEPSEQSPIELTGAQPYRSDVWPADEQSALKKLHDFCERRINQYIEYRDIPSINGTSTLSPYFASGLISARQCLAAVQQHQPEWRSDPWLREVAWREFYRYLMYCFPRLSKSQPFKPETTFLAWENNPDLVTAWKQGKTGFPIVDAAMRQLAQTGWMHNRLRMITASFFTKLMLEHWTIGEQFFMENLLDGDFASNNGGWQWSASTGCDASPWFRVFNPQSQSQKFDSSGDFIRKFVPELKDLDDKAIHNPPSKVRQHLGYPEPMIDYRSARERVLERFKALTEMNSAQS